MNWWKAHHGISNDSKLLVVASIASIRLQSSRNASRDVTTTSRDVTTVTLRCEVGWVWIILLDYASQASDRGCVTGLQEDEIAVISGLDIEVVKTIMEALKERGLILLNGRLAAWEKRNSPIDKGGGARQRRYRQRQQALREVTLRDVTVTSRNGQIRSDQMTDDLELSSSKNYKYPAVDQNHQSSSSDASATDDTADEFQESIRKIAGFPRLSRGDLKFCREMQSANISLETMRAAIVVARVRRAVHSSNNGSKEPIKSLRYFTGTIEEAQSGIFTASYVEHAAQWLKRNMNGASHGKT